MYRTICLGPHSGTSSSSSSLHPRMTLRIGLWCVLLAAAVVEATRTQRKTQKRHSHNFACVTMDWWPPTKCDFGHCTWPRALWSVNWTSLIPAAQALSPFVLRLGGSLQDYVAFTPDCDLNGNHHNSTTQFPINTSMPQGFGFGCINPAKLLEIIDFCHQVHCDMVWGLNGMQGRVWNDGHYYGDWNATNSQHLLQFLYDHQAPLRAVTLGNEIWALKVNLTAAQALQAYTALDTIISDIWKSTTTRRQRPLMAGFDGNGFSLPYPFYSDVLPQLAATGVRLDILNYHVYPLGSSDAPDVVDRALSPTAYQDAYELALQAHATAKWYAQHPLQVWVSESGGSYDSGSPAATGSYASGFWYLSNLAATHAAGHTHFCRQTLTGGFYGLLSSSGSTHHQPRPDFWNTVLYNRLMGTPTTLSIDSVGVVSSHTPDMTENVHSNNNTASSNNKMQWIIHCNKRFSKGHSITILALNYDRQRTHQVQVASSTPILLAYQLSPAPAGTNATNANRTALNGHILQMENEGRRLPELPGQRLDSNVLRIPPLTYAFFEVIGFFLPEPHNNPCSADRTAMAR